MKIIFLDIDGVLNHQEFYESDRWNKEMRDIDPKSVEKLNSLIENTGADIVVSSAWRIGKTVKQLQVELSDLGIKGKIIGRTDSSDKSYIVRGVEIYAWLLTQGREQFKLPYDFKEYVILDDSNDMLLQQINNFVHIDNFVGLTWWGVKKAEKILGKLNP